MTSITISEETNEALNEMVRRGEAKDPADAVRKALNRLAEDDAVNAVLEAEEEVRNGDVVYGDIDEALAATPS